MPVDADVAGGYGAGGVGAGMGSPGGGHPDHGVSGTVKDGFGVNPEIGLILLDLLIPIVGCLIFLKVYLAQKNQQPTT